MKLTMVLPVVFASVAATVDIPSAQVQIVGAVLAGAGCSARSGLQSEGRSAPTTACAAGITRLSLQSPGKSAGHRGPQHRGTRAGKRENRCAIRFLLRNPLATSKQKRWSGSRQSSPDG
jgi:hypothetical protein